jgi:hypothetical protein
MNYLHVRRVRAIRFQLIFVNALAPLRLTNKHYRGLTKVAIHAADMDIRVWLSGPCTCKVWNRGLDEE